VRAKELRTRNEQELRTLLAEAEDQLFKARLENATHQLDNTSSIAKARREVARIKTVIGERAHGAAQSSGPEAEQE
jgi:large subunit ribosomal protein L29